MEGVPGGERQTDMCVCVCVREDASGGGGAAAAPVCVQEVMQGLLTQELLVFQQEKGIKIEWRY